MRRTIRSGLLQSVWLGLCMAAAQAAETGTLAILVSDSFETPLPGAHVSALRIGGPKAVEKVTDTAGRCMLELPIGTYGITVRMAGFRADFTGGVVVRARTDFPLRFALLPGDPAEKLPHEKTPQERAEALARLQAKFGDEEKTTAAGVTQTAYDGLDEALKTCQIERTNGGPAARNDHLKIGNELLAAKKYGEALVKYKLALGEDPSHAITWFNTGVLFGVEQRSKQAETCFRTAIGLCGGGGDSDFHAYLGRALGRQGRLDEAVKCYKAASLINADKESVYLYEIGSLYHSMRQFKAAQEWFEQAVKQNCPEPLLYFAYANCLELQGQKRGAIEHYKEFLKRAESDAALVEYLQRTKEKLEKLGAGE
ncbi:MAG: carboxypeptidase regulatory-like domain-containing protein [Planctomycetes bacterium]|nr:carboxypeptidase regulatory-like domain-containing protein [Planctomycetota bacterium]